jgi:hypothetical protein
MGLGRVLMMMALLWVSGETVFGFTPSDKGAQGMPLNVGQSKSSDERSSSEKAAQAKSTISVKTGRLTLQVQNLPLESVLSEISEQSGVAIVNAQSVAQEQVSLHLRDLPLDQGLQQILKGHDTFFFYGAAAKEEDKGVSRTSLKTIWIYPKGQGERIVPVPPEQWASSVEIEKRLSHPDAAERARSVELLVARNGERALDAVRFALNDRDDQVRERTLHAALYSGMTLPTTLLEDLARTDPSPMVRFLALGAVASGPGESLVPNPNIRTIAELALNDSDPNVKEEARQILEQLEQPPQPLEQENDGGETGGNDGNVPLEPEGETESNSQEAP